MVRLLSAPFPVADSHVFIGPPLQIADACARPLRFGKARRDSSASIRRTRKIFQGISAPLGFHLMTKDTKKTLRSIIIACVAIFALSSVAFALPPEKTGAQLPTLTRQSQFEELKGGDKVDSSVRCVIPSR
jgi:hypothetical protein